MIEIASSLMSSLGSSVSFGGDIKEFIIGVAEFCRDILPPIMIIGAIIAGIMNFVGSDDAKRWTYRVVSGVVIITVFFSYVLPWFTEKLQSWRFQ